MYRVAVDADEWTSHVDRYIEKLQSARLVPPIVAFHVVDEQDRSVLLLDVASELTENLVERVKMVLGSVPHRLRQVDFSHDGRRPGVSYG